MSKFGQKGAALQLILITLLILGIGVGVYLTQFTQVFKPKASTTKSAVETELNPYGELWSSKKAANPQAIAVSLSATLPSNINSIPVSQEMINYYSKSNAPFVYFDSSNGELEDSNYQTRFDINKKKALFSSISPNVNVIGYVVFTEGHLAVKEVEQHSQNSQDPEMAKYEAFYVHQRGVSPGNYSKANRVNLRPDHPEWEAYLFDITNPEYRAFIIPKMVAAMDNMGLDGVMADGMYLDGLGVLKDQVDSNKVAAWPDALGQFAQELKSAMGNKYLFGNVSRADLGYVRDTLLAPGRMDGILLEDPIGRSEQTGNLPPHDFYPGIETWDQTSAMLNMVRDKNKYAMFIVNANINGVTDDTKNDAVQRRYASYYTAAYLQLYQPNPDGSMPSKQMFLHYFPTPVGPQFNSASFYRDWDVTLGPPTASSRQLAPGIHVRTFQNGYVFLNSTYNNYTLTEGSGLFSTTDGSEIGAGAVIPAKSGRIYVTRAVYDIWNTQPTPSASPSPATSPVILSGTAECFEGKPRAVLKWTYVYFQNAEIYKSPDPLTGIMVSGTSDRNTNPLYDVGTFSPVRLNTDYTYYLKILDGAAAGTTTNSVTVRTPATCETQTPSPSPSPSQSASPSPSPFQSPSPSQPTNPSPSPAGSKGDIDKDGDIDIFDYNYFVQDFAAQNLRSDLNGDGVINVLDFNQFVTAFRAFRGL